MLAILDRLKTTGEQASYIDVRVPSNPAVAMVGEGSVEDAASSDETAVMTDETTATVTTEEVAPETDTVD